MAEPIRWQDAWWHQQPDGTWLRFNDQTQTWEAVPSQPVYIAAPGMGTGAKVAIAAVIVFVGLLVVAILAAIAIPVFLNQRNDHHGWQSQVESALKNAAVAQESYRVTNPSYTPNVGDLDNEGLQVAPAVHIDIRSAETDRYCIEATHQNLPNEVWNYDSDIGEPLEGPCF